MQDGCARAGIATRLDFDWSAWDRRFGPLLDGSAFADLPRKGVPVECFYLPLHENWPSPMEGNYNGDYWADRAFPESYRRAFVAASRQIAEHCPGQGLDRDALSGLPQQQEQLQGQRLVARVVALAAGRAGQLPGLLGPALLRPGLSRRDQPGRRQRATGDPRRSPAGLPRRHLAPAMAARQSRRPARLPCRRQCDARPIRAWSSSASERLARSCSSTARPTRSRAQTSSRSRGAWMSGRWGPMASSPGKRSATPSRGTGPTSCRSFIRPAAQWRASRRADSLDPAQGLSPRPAGRRVSDALVAAAQRAALGGRPAGARGA